jgi:hypothetical protein
MYSEHHLMRCFTGNSSTADLRRKRARLLFETLVLFCALRSTLSVAFGQCEESKEVATQQPPAANTDVVARLVEQLDSKEFAHREAAARELRKLGNRAVRNLESAAKNHPSLEVRGRAQSVLEHIVRDYKRRPAVPPLDKSRFKPIVQRSGKITGDVVWTADRTYHIVADLIVDKYSSLRIEPGAVLLFDDGVDFYIRSARLVAKSDDPQRPILLAGTSDIGGRPGHWGRIINDNSLLTFTNVEIRRGSGINTSGGNGVAVVDSAIYETSGDVFVCTAPSSGHIENVTIRDATGDGLSYRDGANGTITGTAISGIRSGIVVSKQSYPDIKSSKVSFARECGIVVDNSNPRILHSRIEHCNVGVKFHSGSGSLEHITIAFCSQAGIVIDHRSNPDADQVTFESMNCPAIIVKGGSYPFLGSLLKGVGFNGDLLLVAHDARVAPLSGKKKK